MSMFDPLSVPNFPQDEPPWPTTPHMPNEPIPNLPRPSPHHQDSRGPPSGLYGREPQIYGQPEPGLISPQANASSSGKPLEKKEPYLRVRITSLDRNRRDVLIKFDAQVRIRGYGLTHFTLRYDLSYAPYPTNVHDVCNRRTSRISRARPTGTSPARISSSSSSTRPSYRTTPKR